SAVDTVVAKINEVLVEDLFGDDDSIVNNDGGSDEPFDVATLNDPWLCNLEPRWDDFGDAEPTNDGYAWPQITDLYENDFGAGGLYDPQIEDPDPATWGPSWSYLQVGDSRTPVKIIGPKDRTYTVNVSGPVWAKEFAGARADADGDGVADSRWTQIPGLTTSRGEPVFAAVRIIDNCAMLNLNGAHCFYQEPYDSADPISPFEKPWFEDDVDFSAVPPVIYHDNQTSGSGRYLTEINYLPFLRGSDLTASIFYNPDPLGSPESGEDWYQLMTARGFGDVSNPIAPEDSHTALMNIESSVAGFQFFDIGDELELRNRFLLTSKAESRIEHKDIANYTLDSGGGRYSALKVPREDKVENGKPHIDRWYWRVNPDNFDEWSGAVPDEHYKYDRRHVCTVYSYDRNLRKGQYPLLMADIRAYILANGVPVGFASQEDYEDYLLSFYAPKGAVTTNIEDSYAVQPYNNVETRKRILHLLFAFREYFLPDNFWALPLADQSTETRKAAFKAAQIVANLIDYSDDDAPNSQIPGESEGPFYHIDYGQQANIDCTFITEDIIDDMITEVSTAILGVPIVFDFGLNATDIVFGYEKQPFISEIYAKWTENNPFPDEVDDTLDEIAIEVLNPYSQTLDMEGWKLKIGTGPFAKEFVFTSDAKWDVPEMNSGYRAVYYGSAMVSAVGVNYGSVPNLDFLKTLYYDPNSTIDIQLLRPAPAKSGVLFLTVDSVSDTDMRTILNQTPDGAYSLQRDDDNWKFISGYFAPRIATPAGYQLGSPNNDANLPGNGFQIGVAAKADEGLPLCRWHELEVLSLNGYSSDPNVAFTEILADPNNAPYHFDLAGDPNNVLDYITTINRPDLGSLPGRININTAPVHVIAAAIPPTLADPNAAIPGETVTFSALQLAEAIINRRNTIGPYQKISDLLSISEFKQYIGSQVWGGDPNSGNVGSQSIDNDIEEEHWILSNLANKLTVRSDVFTAYILVRLGEGGPQRRMIGIFDRSQVWTKNDRPKLVALHPVPDPR
ncbi:MAG: hypothetical protein B6I25_06430, partial [Planctomycetales bacterium 4572_13]